MNNQAAGSGGAAAEPLKILHLEDSKTDADLILGMLQTAGWQCASIRVETQEDFRRELARGGWDLILADYALPTFNGVAALPIAMSSAPLVPFIFVTGAMVENAAIDTLRCGATDYVLKQHLARLVPAVRRALAEAHEHRRLAEVEARNREQATLLNLAADAIVVTDLEGRLTFWNHGAELLYGWQAAEAMGKHFEGIVPALPSEDGQQPVRVALEKGVWQGELRQASKPGRDVVVLSRWTLVRESGGRPKGFLIINTDITEKKKIEAQFYRSQRLENIGALAGGIAHDLNNILAPLLMSVQFFRTKLEGDADSQMLVDTLETSVQRGAGMVSQVLAFARGVDGEHTLLQPRHVAREVLKMTRQTFPRNIRLTEIISRELWTVKADATLLYQVIMNLAVNARDALPHGGEILFGGENVQLDAQALGAHRDAKPGPYVVLTVRDNGAGIPPAIRERIFEAFFTTKEPGRGTGLGLATTLNIVKSHGGFIEVESEVGKGSTFKIYLPATEGTKTTQVQPASRLAALRGNGELVLIVDDEQSVRQICKATLEACGYRTLLADDGAGALAVCTQHRGQVQAVILDLMMPVMDGAVALKALRRMAPEAQVIMSSGFMEDAKREELARDGCAAFLPKPYSTRELLTVLRTVLEGKP